MTPARSAEEAGAHWIGPSGIRGPSTTDWFDLDRRAREEARGAVGDTVCVDAEAACLASWLSVPSGARVGLASDCAGCHARSLAARGLRVEPFDPDGPGEGIFAPAAPADPGSTFAAIVLVGRTLLPFWEVEEIHRHRLRAAGDRLIAGGRLVFGDRAAFGRSDLELARLVERYARFPEARADLSALGQRRRFTHYTAAQARTLLEQCGYALDRIHNGFDDRQPYAHHEPGMIFVCRRA